MLDVECCALCGYHFREGDKRTHIVGHEDKQIDIACLGTLGNMWRAYLLELSKESSLGWHEETPPLKPLPWTPNAASSKHLPWPTLEEKPKFRGQLPD